jgi:uncharacterized protein (UPF0333 family)
MRKAQVSIEYMTMLGLSLIALFAIWFYVNSSNDNVQQNLRVEFGRQTVSRIADAANMVFAQGPPAKMYVEINNPEGVIYAIPFTTGQCDKREVSLTISTLHGGNTDMVAPVSVNVSGNLSFLVDSPGLKKVWVEAIDYNGMPCVLISSGG